VGNYLMGSMINAGEDRLTNAGLKGIPQMVSIGCYDLVDIIAWQSVPLALQGADVHAHNRLLASVLMNADQRRQMAKTMCDKLSTACGPVNFILPVDGGNEWDRPGGILSQPEALAEFIDEIRASCPKNVNLIELDAHINDDVFIGKVLEIFDHWVSTDVIKRN